MFTGMCKYKSTYKSLTIILSSFQGSYRFLGREFQEFSRRS